MGERYSASACLANETCLSDGAIANESRGSVGRWALPSLRSMIVAVPERRTCVVRCMRCGLRGSSCEDGVDLKQTSYEACMEWR